MHLLQQFNYIVKLKMSQPDDIPIAETIKWSTSLEEYFKGTGEKAHALAWLHKRSEERYSKLRAYIDIPVIILGTINGATSIGSSAIFGDNKYASMAIGGIAIVTALLTTISSYYSWSKRAEGHRISALQYNKLYRQIEMQLHLPRESRTSPTDLIKFVKHEYDRLSELSPLVPSEIIQMFKTQFSGPKYKDLQKPEETNGLHTIQIYNEKYEEILQPAPLEPPSFFQQNDFIYPGSIAKLANRPTCHLRPIDEISIPMSAKIPASPPLITTPTISIKNGKEVELVQELRQKIITNSNISKNDTVDV